MARVEHNTSADITMHEPSTSGLFSDLDKLDWMKQKLSTSQKAWTFCELRSLATTALDPLRRPASQKSAQLATQVYNIPELLEQILYFLNAKDILQASTTNKFMAAALPSSSTIQKKLCLKVDADSFFQTPFAKGLFRSVWLEQLTYTPLGDKDDPFDQDKWYKDHSTLFLRMCFGSGRVPRPGTRYRSMNLCQPHVTEMTLIPTCCNDDGSIRESEDSTTRPRVTKIASATGVTLGQLIDEAAKLQEAHRLCPDIESQMLKPDGTALVGVICVGAISLRYDDPIRVYRREAPARDREIMEERKAEDKTREKLEAYTNAKREAASKSQAIPTLAEYEAS
ncbi:hypothetical protein LTR37_013828 [Vermiconidia calcicola]|uniref:Uncharacterized protein n=1 Tax=Vermiconidia calcicola TaxID=1690605 RepID=A0ACC3MV78_9PEZI|nr:hypothetical protein LTR37_013828 [Vermiconidia calcicola]